MKKLLLASVLFVAYSGFSQEENKKATVRIKKVENINGVEKITDTTYVVDNPDDMKWIEMENVVPCKPGEGNKMKIMIKNDEDGNETENIQILSGDEKLDAEIEKALKEAGVDKNSGTKKIIIMDKTLDEDENGSKSERVTKVIIMKAKIEDVNENELRQHKKQFGNVDNKIEMEEMMVYPNPADGKFNLKFNIKSKGLTEIKIFDIQGKSVYQEKIENFSGEYKKTIDLSQNDKGIYFVKISQGEHSKVKKLIID